MSDPIIPAPESFASVEDTGWHESADAWIEFVETGDANRDLLLDPVMMAEVGEVRDLQVLDVGCGEGRFGRMLHARGASVVGIDPTVPLIEFAARRGGARFMVASGETIPFRDATFDLVVSYLVLIDIPDYRAAIREMTRVMKPGAQLVIANLNPFATTGASPWHKDGDGRLLHLKVDRYFEEKAERVGWRNIEIVNWHRPMQDYMQALLSAGLLLRSFHEPRPSRRNVELAANLASGLRVPLFHVMRWEKPR